MGRPPRQASPVVEQSLGVVFSCGDPEKVKGNTMNDDLVYQLRKLEEAKGKAMRGPFYPFDSEAWGQSVRSSTVKAPVPGGEPADAYLAHRLKPHNAQFIAMACNLDPKVIADRLEAAEELALAIDALEAADNADDEGKVLIAFERADKARAAYKKLRGDMMREVIIDTCPRCNRMGAEPGRWCRECASEVVEIAAITCRRPWRRQITPGVTMGLSDKSRGGKMLP